MAVLTLAGLVYPERLHHHKDYSRDKSSIVQEIHTSVMINVVCINIENKTCFHGYYLKQDMHAVQGIKHIHSLCSSFGFKSRGAKQRDKRSRAKLKAFYRQMQRTKLRNGTVQHNSQPLGKSVKNGKGVDNNEPALNIFVYETAAVDHYVHYNEAENRHKNDDSIIFHILHTTVAVYSSLPYNRLLYQIHKINI